MQMIQNPIQDSNWEWVKILAKGMVTIPKIFRDQIGLKVGDVARVKKVGNRLVIEPRELADYEVYSEGEYKQMLAEDKLPKNLAKKAVSFWSDFK